MLNDFKMLLGFSPEEELDEVTEQKLNLLLEYASSGLKNLLGGTDVPSSMEHIVVQVAVKKFNRIGSEGMSSHTMEGESMTYASNDYEEFMTEISAYMDSVNANSRRGGFRFL